MTENKSLDTHTIENLFTKDDNSFELRYAKKNSRYLQDTNHGVYTNGSITFDTQNLTNDKTLWSESYVEGQFSCSSTGTTYGTDLNLCPVVIKGTAASLISSCLIHMNDRQVSTQRSIAEWEWLKYYIHTSYEKSVSVGDQDLFFKDEFDDPNNVLDYTSDATAQGVSGAHSRDAKKSYQNKGMVRRIQFRDITLVGGVLTFKVKIPLRMVSPIFEQMDYPVSGVRFRITLNVNDDTEFAPLIISPFRHSDDTTATVPPTKLTVVPNSVRLYYTDVVLDAESNIAWSKLMSQPSVKKVLRYTSCKKHVYSGAETDEQIRMNITSISNLERVYVTIVPRTRANTKQTTSNQYANLPMGAMSNFSLFIDNVPYYEQPITRQEHFYELLEDVMNKSRLDKRESALISWGDFQRHLKVYAFDVSRLKLDRPVDVLFNFDKVDSNTNGVLYVAKSDASDVSIFLEYRVETEFDMKTGQVISNEQ